MKAEEFDRIFDEGKEDILDYVDLDSATRPNQTAKKVNVDFPNWMVDSLDREAKRFGVARQALIKIWLAEKLESINHHKD